MVRMWQYLYRYSPTASIIGEKYGVKRGTISQILLSLKKKGYIELSPHKNWQHRVILFPKGTTFDWGTDELPDELFDHMKKKPVNG